MKIALLVVEDFLTFTKGDVIDDTALVKKYEASEYQAHFIKTAAPAEVVAAAAAAVTADAAAK